LTFGARKKSAALFPPPPRRDYDLLDLLLLRPLRAGAGRKDRNVPFASGHGEEEGKPAEEPFPTLADTHFPPSPSRCSCSTCSRSPWKYAGSWRPKVRLGDDRCWKFVHSSFSPSHTAPLPLPAHLLALLYFCQSSLGVAALAGLKGRRTRLLLAWIVLALLAFLPEAGMVLYMAVYHWVSAAFVYKWRR